MKKAYLFLTFYLFFVSCHKDWDNPGKDTHCRIIQLKTPNLNEEEPPFRIGTIHYNQYGQPDSITYNEIPFTGAPWYQFGYDEKHRLTDFLLVYTGKLSYDSWYRYHYDDYGRISSDTIYSFGGSEGNYPVAGDYAFAYVDFYGYDQQNRITSISSRMIYPSNTVDFDTTTYYTYYHYNEKGNLGDNYSSALNINSTNKIFQFINRDYSVNSPVEPLMVNEKNLPVKYGPNSDAPPYGLFFDFAFANTEIEYDCGSNSN